MFRGKPFKGQLVAGFLVATLLLQGCSSPDPDSKSGPSVAEEEAAEDYEYNPKLSPVFDEPWPTKITRQELVETALYRSFEFMNEVRVESCPVNSNLFISEKAKDEHISIIEMISGEMNLVFCDYLTKDITIVSGGYDFLKEVIESENLPKDEFDGICGYEVPRSLYLRTGCASQGVAWVGIPVGRSRGTTLNKDSLATHAHEIFHLVQDSADPGQSGINQSPENNFFRPVWWVEGGGEFFGRLFPRYLHLQDYSFTPSISDGAESIPMEEFSKLKDFEFWGEGFSGNNNHYYVGQIALEYLAANSGFGAVMELLDLMGNGAEFEDAFEESIGISVAIFYEKFALMHDNLLAY